MMLEGEVMLKNQFTSKQQLLPVMVNSDEEEFTFDDWLSLALESQRGMKIHFKTIESVDLCLQKLSNRKELVSLFAYFLTHILLALSVNVLCP